MRRWFARITMCLILGAATTVAVAWIIALGSRDDWSNATTSSVYRLGFDEGPWPARWHELRVNRGFGRFTLRLAAHPDSQTFMSEARYELPAWSRAKADADWMYDTVDVGLDFVEQARGWPWLALRSEGFFEIDWKERRGRMFAIVTRIAGDPLILGAAWDPTTPSDYRVQSIPLRPIWRGLLAAALVFGAMWFVLLFTWPAVRKVVRRRRGRCVRCGYDLTMSEDRGCPECGWNRAG